MNILNIPLKVDKAGSSSHGRIQELDGIRGIAILLVVVMHYFYFYPAASHHPEGLFRKAYVLFERCIAIGWCGVDLFFVLSGFLIGGILLDARSSDSYFKTFYLRRFFRIIPIYYLWIVVYILLAAVVVLLGRPVGSIGEPTSWPEIAAQFAFLQNFGFIHYAGLGSAFFISTWSLAVEEQFYLVAPVVVRSVSERLLFWLLSSVLVLAPLLRVFVNYHFYPFLSLHPGYSLMPCRADSLAMGMLIALFWRKEQARSWLQNNLVLLYSLFVLLFAGVAFLDFYSPSHGAMLTQVVGYSWLAFFFSIVLILALVHPSGPVASVARMRWLREFGRISYCLYLIHEVVNNLCHQLLLGTSETTSDWREVAVPIVALGVAFLIAHLSWIYYERPLQQRGHAFRY